VTSAAVVMVTVFASFLFLHKAKQSHTPAPEDRHRTRKRPAQRQQPAAGATSATPTAGKPKTWAAGKAQRKRFARIAPASSPC
ncbi:hypothetical protein ACWD6P_31445, partial [Streptomyces sp. NPDC002446]